MGQTQSEVRLESSPSCSRDTLMDLHQQPSRPLHSKSVPQSLQFFVFDNGHACHGRLIIRKRRIESMHRGHALALFSCRDDGFLGDLDLDSRTGLVPRGFPRAR